MAKVSASTNHCLISVITVVAVAGRLDLNDATITTIPHRRPWYGLRRSLDDGHVCDCVHDSRIMIVKKQMRNQTRFSFQTKIKLSKISLLFSCVSLRKQNYGFSSAAESEPHINSNERVKNKTRKPNYPQFSVRAPVDSIL